MSQKKKENMRNKCRIDEVVNEKGMLDTREASHYLGVSPAYIRQIAKSGVIDSVLSYFGNTRMFTKKALDAYNKNHTRDPRKGNHKKGAK